MEKAKNNYFKAVSIISLIIAIASSVSLLMIIIGASLDIEYFVNMLLYEEFGGISLQDFGLVINDFVAIVVCLCVYLVGYIVFNFLAYFKMKKYSRLTMEEAKQYSGRIIAWAVLFFVFDGFISGLLVLFGYFGGVKEQKSNIDNSGFNKDNIEEKQEEITEIKEETENQIDTDKTMERLERLNKLKEKILKGK